MVAPPFKDLIRSGIIIIVTTTIITTVVSLHSTLQKKILP